MTSRSDQPWADLAAAIRAISDTAFHRALEAFISHALPFDNYLLIAYFADTQPVVVYRSSQSRLVHQELATHYVRTHYVLDPFYIAHLQGVPAGLYRLLDVAPDKFRNTDYFKRYYEQTTLCDELAFFAYPEGGWTLNVCIGRDETSGQPFRKADVSNAQMIAPAVIALLESRYRDRAFKRISRRQTADPVEVLRRRLKSQQAIEITERQAEVALLTLRGHSAKSVGAQLGISWQTVRVFRRQLYERCAVASQAELFAKLLPLI